ncbi:hypothetical protein EDB83DRAFT_2341378 [Lactarius deliciosus]|nr:hypothetical protein EDB83DRAFT_2341378 [Lactarius deliciosus]
MPLNYSKWDQLEARPSFFSLVSDDSDIEGHPNVDNKSLIRIVLRSLVTTSFSLAFATFNLRLLSRARHTSRLR